MSPMPLFMLLMGILKTQIQNGEYWNVTLSGLRSSLKRFIRINFFVKSSGTFIQDFSQVLLFIKDSQK